MSVAKAFTLKLNDKVLALLRENPKYRDSDEALIARIWSDAVGGHKATTGISMYEFLKMYVDGKDSKFVPAESIRRCRQRIQEKLPETRGEVYLKRHKEEQDDMKNNLGYNDGKTP